MTTDETPEQEQQPEEELEQPQDATEESESDGDTFPRDYVEKLRQESAESRTARKDAEQQLAALQDAYRGLAVTQAVSDVLADSTDLPWSDDYLDAETGLVDASKVRTAAEELALAKPHLARARGDAGQGYRSTNSGTVNLADMLRSNA